jgi:hypothetical protein
MMTVLLMVYLLLSMIFQVLAAMAGPPVDGAPASSSSDSNSSAGAVEMTDKLIRQSDDFVTRVGRDENFLQPAARTAVRGWMNSHAQAIRQRGLVVFSSTSATDAPLGVRMRLQYERSLMVVAIADELGIPRDKIDLRNPVPDDGGQDSIVLRLK